MAATVKTRVQLKYDTEEHWSRALHFTPLKGEVIIYSADNTHPFSRIKVGDGTTPVIDLPFISANCMNKGIEYHTTEYWDARRLYIPNAGEIIIYSDKRGQNMPALKIGDGSSYLIDLPFLDDLMMAHIRNTEIHVSAEDRIFWNNKLNCEDIVEDENLQLNRR